MANLIDGFTSVLATVKLVGEIQHVGIGVADILVSMNDARWDDDGRGILNSDHNLDLTRSKTGPIFPEAQFVGPVDKGKQIGLMNVLVGSPRDSGVGDADVAHAREESFGKFVGSKKLGQLSSGVAK